jgi:flagellar basal-body rod protein FlgB
MGIANIPLFTALAEKMKWHQTRQGLLAENVANAETPGFRGRDLKAFGFEEHMRNLSTASMSSTSTSSNPMHIAIGSADSGGFGPRQLNNFEITPEGNGITLEDEMMKVAGNQMDYQTVTTLYTRSLRVIRMALGKQ